MSANGRGGGHLNAGRRIPLSIQIYAYSNVLVYYLYVYGAPASQAAGEASDCICALIIYDLHGMRTHQQLMTKGLQTKEISWYLRYHPGRVPNSFVSCK